MSHPNEALTLLMEIKDLIREQNPEFEVLKFTKALLFWICRINSLQFSETLVLKWRTRCMSRERKQIFSDSMMILSLCCVMTPNSLPQKWKPVYVTLPWTVRHTCPYKSLQSLSGHMWIQNQICGSPPNHHCPSRDTDLYIHWCSVFLTMKICF